MSLDIQTPTDICAPCSGEKNVEIFVQPQILRLTSATTLANSVVSQCIN